ncbi:hypothetical protein [Caulobacter phage Cr30]|uniref:hypothetical protein n=1 Tax=Caulobacter phage Cr30 TaxID=1357714 RepID=UPI0004A9B4FE|nr:hypothetical protein OZ74_gp042 [Caulobacter phage Cr30]AGS80927.1 hypothetical protein [Caulobacter phage Cr30]
MAEWNECKACETEFKVICSDYDKEVQYCVFCGAEVESEDDVEVEDFDDED